MGLVQGSARAGAAEGIPVPVTVSTIGAHTKHSLDGSFRGAGNRQIKVDPRAGEPTLSIIPDINIPYLWGGSPASQPAALGPATAPED